MSTQPSALVLTTDFPTLKNDATGTAVITIQGSLSVPANGQVTAFVDMTLGKQGAIARARFASDQNGNTWYIGQYQIYARTGVSSAAAAPYNVGVFLFRVAPTTLRLQVVIPNPYSATLTGITALETINVQVNTFIPPYS